MAVGRYRQSAVFQPFTFEQMIKPYQIATEAYNTAEKDLNEQLDKYAVMEAMADDTIQDRIEQYKNFVNDTNDKIASGNADYRTVLESARRARDYYRDYAPKIAAAYEIVQAARKGQQELRLKDPSGVFTALPTMREAMDNPNFQWDYLSGDKIHKDMLEAGKLFAQDINSTKQVPSDMEGYIKQIITKGYTPQEQGMFAQLASAALNNGVNISDIIASSKWSDDENTNNAIKREMVNKFSQPWQALSTYVSENGFDKFNKGDQAMILNRALSGILEGMTGSETPSYTKDLKWEENSQKRIAKYKNDLSNSSQTSSNNIQEKPVAAPQTKSPLKKDLQDKLTGIAQGKVVYKVGDNYFTEQQLNKNAQLMSNPLNANAVQFGGQGPQAPTGVANILEASADIYRKKDDVKSKMALNDAESARELNKLFGRDKLPSSAIRVTEREMKSIDNVARPILNKYTRYEDIPESEKEILINRLVGPNGQLSGFGKDVDYEAVARLLYDRLHSELSDMQIPDWALSKKEIEELEKQGVRFRDEEGNVRNGEDIYWDAYDLINTQHEMFEMTGTRGAGEEASKSMTHDYFAQYGSQTKKSVEGTEIVLRPSDKSNELFNGFNEPMYFLDPYLLRTSKEKYVRLNDGENTYTVPIKLTRYEEALVEDKLNKLKRNCGLSRMSDEDFLKYVEIYGITDNEGNVIVTINDVMSSLSNAIVDGQEENFKVKKSETSSKTY